MPKRITIILFFVLAFALLCVRPAHASGTVSASPANSAPAACEAAIYSANVGSCGYVTASGGAPYFQNGYWYCPIITKYCPGVYKVGLSPAPPATCPPNSTGSTTCTCDTGFHPDATATLCEADPPPDPCASKAGQGGTFTADGTSMPSFVCSSSCQVYIDAQATNGQIVVGQGQFTGVSCVPSDSPAAGSTTPAPPSDCSPGLIRMAGGACITPDALEIIKAAQNLPPLAPAVDCVADPFNSACAGVPAPTPPPDSPKCVAPQVLDSTGQNCVAPSTTPAPGTTTPTKTDTIGNVPQPDGTVASGVVGTRTENVTTGPFDPVGVLGAVPQAEGVRHTTPRFDYSRVVFASSMTCPAPIVFNITGLPFISRSYSFSYDQLCNIAGSLRPIFLTLASITAAFIFASALTL